MAQTWTRRVSHAQTTATWMQGRVFSKGGLRRFHAETLAETTGQEPFSPMTATGGLLATRAYPRTKNKGKANPGT